MTFLVCMIAMSWVQLLSRVWLSATPWTAEHQAFLSITNSRSLLKLMFTELVMTSNHLILCCPLLLLPSILPSIRVFFKHQGQFFPSGGQSIGVSASVSVFPMMPPRWFPLGLVGSPCSPRDSQESSPKPQFKSINSSALSFLYNSTLIHTRLLEKSYPWLNGPLLQSNVSAF